ncbi:MAG: TldD/PmbA family protein [Syntrophomonadaceae bacterium]
MYQDYYALDTDMAGRLLDIARRKKVDAEVFVMRSRELSIEVINGQVDTFIEAEASGLGIRVINAGRLGFAYSSDFSAPALQKLLDDAITMAKYTTQSEHNRLPQSGQVYAPLEIFDNNISRISVEDKIELARHMERNARAYDPRVTVIERAGYEDGEVSQLIMNTRGINAFARGNYCGSYVFVVAEQEGDAQTGFSVSLKKKYADLQPEAVAIEAASKAVRSLKAFMIPSGRIPCLLDPYVMTRFLGIIARMVDAEAVQKGKSLFAGAVGQQVAAASLNLVDDGLYADGIASFPFDDEGVASQTTSLIEQGQFMGYLYDTYTASCDGAVSTGNGQRGSFRGLPSVGTTNFMLLPGEHSRQELCSDIDYGFYITEVMGMHTANPISGDFSVGAAGFVIRQGQEAEPVRGVTIAGNIIDLLKDIEAIGNDLRFFGAKAAPTVRIRNLSIGGE